MYVDHVAALRMRAIEERDLEPLRLLHNDERTLWCLGDTAFVTPAMQKDWFESLKAGRSRAYVIETIGELVPRRIDELVAFVRLGEIDSINRSIRVGLDIVPELRGHGYGTTCFRLLLKWCFEELNMNLCWLWAAEFNEPAKGLYRKLGLSETGRLPQALYRHGAYHDMILFALLREDWEEAGTLANG